MKTSYEGETLTEKNIRDEVNTILVTVSIYKLYKLHCSLKRAQLKIVVYLLILFLISSISIYRGVIQLL